MKNDTTEIEAAEMLKEGLEILFMWSRNIAMLPLEDWLTAFNHAEAVGPFIDPTLFREYMQSGKGDVIKDLIRAAIPLKRAVLRAQPACRAEMGNQ